MVNRDALIAALKEEIGASRREARLIEAINVFRNSFHSLTEEFCVVEIDPSLVGVEELLVAVLKKRASKNGRT